MGLGFRTLSTLDLENDSTKVVQRSLVSTVIRGPRANEVVGSGREIRKQRLPETSLLWSGFRVYWVAVKEL